MPETSTTRRMEAEHAEDVKTQDAKWYGVYLHDGDGEPVAVFRNGDHAQQWRKTQFGVDNGVVLETTGLRTNNDAKPLLESMSAVETVTQDPDAELRGQV